MATKIETINEISNRIHPITYRLYVVTHGESSTVQDNNIDFGYIGEDNNPNILNINQLKSFAGLNGRLTIYRAAQPGSVFMSGIDSNEDLRDNYVGTDFFPNFARRTLPRRNVNSTIVARNVEGKSGNNYTSHSEHVLMDTLQMFTDMDINGNPINDEIFNERLLTDVGYQQGNNINTVNVLDAENEFGVWLKVIGGKNVIGTWPQNKRQGKPGEFYKIISNQDEMFIQNGEPKEIRIHEFIKNIIDVLKTSGVKKKVLVKNTRARNSSGHNRKWPEMNPFIDNVEIFFANCSPSEMHEKRARLINKLRLRKDNCNNLTKWFNLFCLTCKRIQIFQIGRARIRNFMAMNQPIFSTNDIINMSYLDSIDIPWAIIDKEERGELYKNIICILKNFNSWLYYLDANNQSILINNLLFFINNITTPLHLGGTGQITEKIVDNDKLYDTITSFTRDIVNRYLHNTNYIGNVLDSIWDGQSYVRNYQLNPFILFDQNIFNTSGETKQQTYQNTGGKKTRKRRKRRKRKKRKRKKKKTRRRKK